MQSGQILTTWKILKIPHSINMTYHFHFLSSIIRITAKKSIPILGLTYICIKQMKTFFDVVSPFWSVVYVC